MKTKTHRRIGLRRLCFGLVATFSAAAQSATLLYEYNALGRLVAANDSVNGKRQYEYDPAGNRTFVQDNYKNPAWLTVATPTLSPAGGTYIGVSPTVTITSATAGATIFYTTNNNTAPSIRSTRYTGPITATNVTLRAIALKSGMNASALATAQTYVTPLPAIPTGLSSRLIAAGAYSVSWTASVGATRYTVFMLDGTYVQIPSGSTTSISPSPRVGGKWIRACNSVGCSAQANF